DPKLAVRDLIASTGKSHPGIIGIDGTRFRQVCPEVEEYQVSVLDGAVLLTGGTIMWIADVGVDGYMHVGSNQSQLLDQGQETLLHAVLVHRHVRAQIIA